MPTRTKTALRLLLAPDTPVAILLFLFALALRAYGVRGSLPYVGHPDEPKLVDSAVHIVKTGDLNPHLYIWPSLFTYLEALVVRAHVVWGLLRGYYTSVQSLPDVSHIFAPAPGVYVWTRLFAAFVGALSVVLLYFLGKSMFNGSRRVGVAAALMLAVSPLHVEYSHHALTDVPLGMAGILVLWASYRFSRATLGSRETMWCAALCGLLVGVAAGTKYNGLYLGFVPLIAWAIAWWRSRRAGGAKRPAWWGLSALGLIPLGAAVGFLLCEPYALLDWPSFSGGFAFQVRAYEPAKNLTEVWASVTRQMADLGADNGYFFAPALLGALLLLANPPVRNRAWLLIPFPLFYLLAMSRFSLTYVRNLIVTMPFLALMGGYLFDVAAAQVVNVARGLPLAPGGSGAQTRRLWSALRWAALGLALAFVLAEPLRVAAAYARYTAAPDSRNVAWQWVQGRLRTGERFAAELHPWQTQAWPDVLAFDVENVEDLRPLTARPPDWYASHGYGYILLNYNYREAWRSANWDLFKALPVVQRFAGDREGGKGPGITVLALSGASGPPNAPPLMTRSGALLEDFAVLEGYDLAPVASPDTLLDPATTASVEGTPAYKRGEAVGLNLYYRALRDGNPGEYNWQVWVHMVDPSTGGTVAQVDVTPLTGMLRNYPDVSREPHPVAEWHKGELLAGVYNFSLPPGIKPGKYRLETGMWVPPNGPGARIAYSAEGKVPPNAPQDHVLLGEIEVR